MLDGNSRPGLLGFKQTALSLSLRHAAAMSEIAAWLEGLGLGKYVEMFAESEIDFEVLPE